MEGFCNKMKMEFLADSSNEGFARVAVGAFVAGLDPTVDELADIKTAVSEAVTNCIIHGYEQKEGNIWIQCSILGRVVEISVTDTGKGIKDIALAREPLFTTKPELERSGMGFAFMEAFMDEVEVVSEPWKGTCVTMRKAIGGNADLQGQAKNGNKSARDDMVQKNMGLVWSIVHRFANRGHELEDLFQVGSIGLMKAIDKFDTSFDVKFSTYAVPMITGEIKRFLRDDGMIKVSRSLKESGAKMKQAREKLQAEYGREPTLQEISEETGLSREEIVMALEANGEIESIDRSYAPGDGKETSLADRLPQEKDSHEKLLNHMLLEQLLAGLGDTERRLIELRYFGERTQMQVAAELGISQVQVSRLEKKILLGMRSRI